MNIQPQKMINRSKKVFVGGLSATTNAEDLSEYFSQFGKVQESMLLFDKQTNRHRGFAFVTFETEDAAEMVVKKHFHEIKSKIVECKVAQPKEIMMGTPARTPRTRPVLAPGAYPYTPVDPTTAYLLNIGNLAYQRAPATATHYATYPHSYTIPGTIGGAGFSFVDPQAAATAIYHPSLQLAPSPIPAQTQTLYANDMATAAAVASLARVNAAAALGVPQQAAGARIEQFSTNQTLGQIQAGALTNGDIKLLSSYNATAQGALASYPAVSNARALAAAAGTAASTGAEPLLAAATADPNVGAHYINCTNSQTGYSANIPASLAGHLATPGAALITGLTYQ